MAGTDIKSVLVWGSAGRPCLGPSDSSETLIGNMIAKNYRNVFAVLAAAGFVAAGTLLLLLAEFHEEITEPWLSQLDQLTMATIHRWASPGLDKMMFGLSFVGSWKFMPVAAVVVSIVLAWRRCARELLLFALALGGSAILNLGLKAWFHRVR